MYDPLPIVTALNIILAQFAARNGGIRVGKSKTFFRSDTNLLDLGGGLEAFKGYFASVRPSLNQLMVNVNVSIGFLFAACPRSLLGICVGLYNRLSQR